MKKIKIILFSIAGLAFCYVLYLAGEQIWLYHKHGKQNLHIVVTNFFPDKFTTLCVFVDDIIVYDNGKLYNPGYYSGGSMKVSFGKHIIEVKKDDKSLHKDTVFVGLHRLVVVDCFSDSTVGVQSFVRNVLLQ